MKKIIITLVLVTFIFTSCKKEKQNTSTEKSQEIEHISNADFKVKIKENNAQLVDVRTPDEYKEGYLENATLINYKTENFIKNALKKLDKSKPVYVYCHSGQRSASAAELLQKEGFKVYNMKGGISGWKKNDFKTVISDMKSIKSTSEKGTTSVKEVIKLKETVVKKEQSKQNKPFTAELISTNTSDFKSKIKGKNVQLIDVRTPKEYKEGHIPKAKNINIYNDDFMRKASVLDKSKPVYVYCRSGVRSMKAANKLKNAGYKVYNLNDGIKGWEKEGNRIDK